MNRLRNIYIEEARALSPALTEDDAPASPQTHLTDSTLEEALPTLEEEGVSEHLLEAVFLRSRVRQLKQP